MTDPTAAERSPNPRQLTWFTASHFCHTLVFVASLAGYAAAILDEHLELTLLT